MTHRSDIVSFDVNDNEVQVREKINKEPHSVYPICEGDLDNLKGVVSIKDLYVADDLTKFKELMKPALFVPDNVSAYMVLEKFKESKIHCCYIVDEYGSVKGMITLNDILEAIVGDIPEQHTDDYGIVKREDGSFLVDAQIPFYDFLTYFEQTEWMNEGDQDFNTLAGFILHKLEHIPQTGETLDWKGFKIEIIDMDAQRIDKVLVQISKDIKEEMEEE
jgi:putative hemolysin